jgi:hypothetical protein
MIECNGRYNGSTYSRRIANKLGMDCWIARRLSIAPRSFADLDLGLEYSSFAREGIVIVSWGSIANGVLTVLAIASDQNRCSEMIREFGGRNGGC